MERNLVHPNIMVAVLMFWIITLLSQPRLVAATERHLNKSKWDIFLSQPQLVNATEPNELPADEPRKVIMTISPAPEPTPSLKYKLLPKFQDQTPGNAALFYCYAFSRLPEDYEDKLWDKLYEFYHTPPEKLPKKEVHDLLREYEDTLDYLKLATSKQRCDWELPLQNQILGPEPPCLPDFYRFSRILALQARLQIVEAKYEAALSTLQQGVAIARHFGEGPILDLNPFGLTYFLQLEEFVQGKLGTVTYFWFTC